MPATGGRRGRRDNGLEAAEYAAVGDIDPRIGEHLLDVLAAGGIAAYLQPSTDLHPITRTTSLPARPTDRLFVDRDHLHTAKEYVRQISAESDRPHRATDRRPEIAPSADANLDDAFRAIIEGYHRDVDPDRPPWPQSEEVAQAEPRRMKRVEPVIRADDLEEPSILDGLDTFGADLPDDPDDEGYVPPPPPPLPRISSAAGVGVLCVAFGMLLFIVPEIMPLSREMTLIVAFGSIVLGFGTLIWRLRPGDDDDDDLDDGARV